MLLLSVTGVALLAKRSGGLRHLLRAPLFWQPGSTLACTGRAPGDAGSVAICAHRNLYVGHDIRLHSGWHAERTGLPAVVAGGPAAPISTLAALRATDLNDLRELVYPRPGDPEDFYSLRTAHGDGYIDQATGALLLISGARRYRAGVELRIIMHTGEGLWWLALLLGLCALSVPLMSGTGVSMWWQRRRSMPGSPTTKGRNKPIRSYWSAVKVTAPGGSPRRCADALTQTGLRVHTAAMNQLATEYRAAQRILFLTATYGDGNPPGSADQFLARFARRGSFQTWLCGAGFR